MSYFAEPNFIIYDEWLDNDLEKTNFDIKNKKLKTTKNLHEIFYELSNNKIGASENNMQIDTKANKKELITNNFLAQNYLDNISNSFSSFSNKKFKIFQKNIRSKLKFSMTSKLFYSLSIVGFLLIFGFLIFLF